jgi:hypothetical protein
VKHSVSAAAFTSAVLTVLPSIAFGASPNEITFDLVPNPAFKACLVKDPWMPASAKVTVSRTALNEVLLLELNNIKPGLAFDLFTVQHSPFLANGSPDPNFKANFGLAWYQSDVQADSSGQGEVVIKTIQLDQIFGFDPTVALPPTNTFHVGFWFNNPRDAAACGFDVTKPTPFNGEHKAGPLAMISLPSATAPLGPLCTNPIVSPSGVTCNP